MYTVQYHPSVVDDIARISTTQRKSIKKAIHDKLTEAPEFFGKPLQFSLKGMRSMRVGDYRVIFLIAKDVVQIVMIGHRRDVYEKVNNRL